MKASAFFYSILLFFLFFVTDTLSAQYPFLYWSSKRTSSFIININPASVIRIVPSTLVMSLTPLVAGGPVTNDVDNSSYLRITSITANNNNNKIVQANITMGTVPAGTVLKLAATKCTTGSGIFGRGYSITLDGSPRKIIDGIGSCYSGDDTEQGYNLTYRWEMNTNNTVNLVAGSTGLVITYTISQW